MIGRLKCAVRICFCSVWGVLASLITITLAVIAPGPIKMVPVLIFAGLLNGRVNQQAT